MVYINRSITKQKPNKTDKTLAKILFPVQRYVYCGIQRGWNVFISSHFVSWIHMGRYLIYHGQQRVCPKQGKRE
jgi:hypothetical protein